jgi:hypothetical protein
MIERKDCPGCGKSMYITSELCSRCKVYVRKKSPKINKFNTDTTTILKRSDIKEFINKIESRGGWCSIEELLVELITLNNEFGKETKFDNKPPHEQLMIMYKNLRKSVL